MDIAQSVFDTLNTRTDEISEMLDEYNRIDEKINSKRYSEKALQDIYYPQRTEIRNNIQHAADSAIDEAHKLIDQYIKDSEEENSLDPADLTDDVKLLQPGITLLPRDIKTMLHRNENNPTMLQIILRYAQEHNIELDGIQYVEPQKQTAADLKAILTYYRHWIDQKNAKDMLKKFFNK